jgi:hypothetical protein
MLSQSYSVSAQCASVKVNMGSVVAKLEINNIYDSNELLDRRGK